MLLQHKILIGSIVSVLVIALLVGIVIAIVKLSGGDSPATTTTNNDLQRNTSDTTTTPPVIPDTPTDTNTNRPSGGRRGGNAPGRKGAASEFKPLLDVDDIKDVESAAVTIIIIAQQLEELLNVKKTAAIGKARTAAAKHFKTIAEKVIKLLAKDSSISSKVRDAIKQLAERPCLPKTVDSAATIAWKADQPPCDGVFILETLKDLLEKSSSPNGKKALSILESSFQEESLEQPEKFADLCEKFISVHQKLDECLPTSPGQPKFSAKQQRQIQKVIRSFAFLKQNDLLIMKEDELDDIDVNAFFATKILSSSPIFARLAKFLLDTKKSNMPPVLKPLIELFGSKGENIFFLNAGAARQLYTSLKSILNEDSLKSLILGLGPDKMFLEILQIVKNDPKAYAKPLCDLKIDVIWEHLLPSLKKECTQHHHRPQELSIDTPATSEAHTATALPEFMQMDKEQKLQLANLPLLIVPKRDASVDDKKNFETNIKTVRQEVADMLDSQKLDAFISSVVVISYKEKDQIETTGHLSLVKSLFNIISEDLASPSNVQTSILATPLNTKDGGYMPQAMMDPGTMRHIAMMHGKLLQVASRIPFKWNPDYLNLIFATDVETLINLSKEMATKYSKALGLDKRLETKYSDINNLHTEHQLGNWTLTELKQFPSYIDIEADNEAHWEYISQEIIMEASHRLALSALIYLDYFLAFVKPDNRSVIDKDYFSAKCSPLSIDPKQLAAKCLECECGTTGDVLHQVPSFLDWDGVNLVSPEDAAKDVISNLTVEQAGDFLMYVTGSRDLPPTGYDSKFIKIKYQEEKDTKTNEIIKNLLPTASTCFSTLYINLYDSVKIFKEKLDKALEYCEFYGKS